MVVSLLSFLPQISRIRTKDDTSGISQAYVLFNFIVATYHFIVMLHLVAINPASNGLVHHPPNFEDWLDFVQFAVVWAGNLLL